MRSVFGIVYFLFCYHTCLLSQTVELKVVGLPDSVTLPSAHVRLEATTGEIVEEFVTDNYGQIEISKEIVKEDLNVVISYVGYKTLKTNLGSKSTFYISTDNNNLDPVLITAEYRPVSQSNSMNITRVIDEERIQKMAAVNLKDALSNELNIKFGEDTYLGTSISLQGLSGENIVIMIDGVPVIGRQGGDIDISQINMVNVERIEVIEGPTAVNFGSNAIAGTINVITKKKSLKPFHFDATGYYESYGQYNVNSSLSWKNKSHYVSGSFARLYFDGWSSGDKFFSFPEKTVADTNRVKQWKPKEQYIGDLAYRYTHKKFFMDLKAGIYDEKMTDRGMPIQPNNEYAFDKEFKTRRYSGSVYFNGKIKKKWAFNTFLAGNYYQRKTLSFFKDLTTLEASEVPSDHDTTTMHSYTLRGGFQYLPLNKRITFELGYDVNFNNISGDRIMSNYQDRIVADFYGSFNWNAFKEFDMKIGLRYGYNSDFNKIPVGSIQLKYRVKEFTFRGSYAMGYRAPSLKEQYMYFVDINHNIQGNENLKEEKSHNAQIGVSWKRNLKEKHLFELQLKGFYNFVYDQIDLYQVENSNLYSYFNNDQVQTAGAGLTFSYKINSFKFGMGVTNQWMKPSWLDYNIDKWLNYWEANSQITYTIEKSNTSFNLFYKFNGSQPNYFLNANSEVEIGEIKAYHIMDANISQTVWKKRIQFTLGAKNLFNVQNVLSSAGSSGAHSVSSGGVSVGRGVSLFASIKLNLDF